MFFKKMFKFSLLLIFVIIVNSCNGDNLCKLCKCDKRTPESKVLMNISLIEIQCDGRRNKSLETLINLENINWPVTPDSKYFVRFNNLNKHFLPQILGSPDVIGLVLMNNSIRNVHENPFKNFPYIEEITLSNNKLFGIEEWFKNNTNLKYLGLSNTSITELQPHCVSHLQHLYELDLSHNSISKLSAEFFEAIQSVEYLHVHHNKIYAIETLHTMIKSETAVQLKYIDLSYNKLTVITMQQFANIINLETLILKENLITNIDDETFVNLNHIKIIDLSFNNLTEINGFKNANTIEILYLNNNKIKNWNMLEIPERLTELYVQSNDLNIFLGTNFTNLKIFNFSYNSLSVLPNIKFDSLEILDLSYNSLTAVPQGMAERTPALDTLILDNNPISLIRFVDRITLRRLSMNHMPLIKTIDYESFKNIRETGSHSSGNITCMELEMSNCPYLTDIDENAMEHINLCKLDLSYNKLKSIPKNLTNWSYIEKGINLQGNPFVCECSTQWILDIIVEQLYQRNEHQYLLRELRCNEPKLFANKRFVKFYGRGDIFCHVELAQSFAQLKTFDEDDRIETAGIGVKLNLKQGPSYITIIISCIVLLLVLIGFGIYWTKQQNKTLRNNRRFT